MCEEPTIELFDGSIVLRAIYDLVLRLVGEGHTITIVDEDDDEDDVVRVDPGIPDDTLMLLDSNWPDVVATLANAGTVREAIH